MTLRSLTGWLQEQYDFFPSRDDNKEGYKTFYGNVRHDLTTKVFFDHQKRTKEEKNASNEKGNGGCWFMKDTEKARALTHEVSLMISLNRMGYSSKSGDGVKAEITDLDH